jgi:MFS family permease
MGSDGLMGLGTSRPGAGRVIATAALALICAALPVFLLGALAPRVGRDLGVDEGEIGLLVSVFFLSSAVASLPGGHVTDRIGSTAALRLAAGIAGLAGLGIAWFGTSYGALLAMFVVAGTAVPMADTGGARAISSGVPLRRQGIAFGGKEASIPVASMLAGIAVPILGAQFGWRPAYVVAAVFAAIVVFLVPRGLDRSGPGTPVPSAKAVRDDALGAGHPGGDASGARHPGVEVSGSADSEVPPVAEGVADIAAGSDEPGLDPARGAPEPENSAPTSADRRTIVALTLLAAGAGLGSAAGNTAPTFLVSSAVSAGITESSAGVLLAVAATAGVVSRLLAGVVADRRGGAERRIMFSLLVIGAVGTAILAFGGPSLTLLGALLAFGGGWGWTGLAFFAAVRLLPDRPARAAGAILAGLASGGALGPLAFGQLAAGPGYTAAWSAGASAMFLGAVLTFAADRTANGAARATSTS